MTLLIAYLIMYEAGGFDFWQYLLVFVIWVVRTLMVHG